MVWSERRAAAGGGCSGGAAPAPPGAPCALEGGAAEDALGLSRTQLQGANTDPGAQILLL